MTSISPHISQYLITSPENIDEGDGPDKQAEQTPHDRRIK